ncbi:hypothetical protein C483_10031 [Natrialba hulunbeirensis JCM 10989]|uniref:Uncharacterized protein n=1 Tax=Natrialba hulunbeirensis JCM 10989 TaxID=1227493 RepID=L9ZYV1_9EURY|nr:hypothetical protein [Natrialba hulunbeirensis]ELY91256.1 hypothetical protein C483_10031 [Natrialba hulunbeirensis JCM 10989]
MRALQHCDFCDSEAAGTFEVLPPELELTDAEQRRVVLCPACKDQLGALLEPLLARLRGEPAAEAGEEDDPSGAGTGGRSEPDSEGGDKSQTKNESRSDAPPTTRGAEITFGDSEAVETAATSALETKETAGSESTGTLEADRELEADPATGTDTEPAGESEPAGELEPVPETESATDADAKSETSATTGETKTDSASTATKTDETSKPSVPQAYPKVIRLLRNRELPMDRNAVESLAAGAYDLEAEQAEAIVDHALEQEEFTERGGKLHRA